MDYAQIKDGVVQNTIRVDENTPLALFAEGFDHFLRIDELAIVPGVGWLFDGNTFSRPSEPT